MKGLTKPMVLLAIVALCLFEFVLHRQSGLFPEIETAFLSLQWMLLVCFTVWAGTSLLPTFNRKDLPLIGLFVITMLAFYISQVGSQPATDALVLLFAVTLGRGASFFLSLKAKGKRLKEEGCSIRNLEGRLFLVGLIVLLAIASWWHLDMKDNYYHGPRWMGLWNNPNDYGLLMGAGVVLATGLLAASQQSRVHSPQLEAKSLESVTGQKSEVGSHKQTENPKSEIGMRKAETIWRFAIRNWQCAILLVAALMMGVGLVMSYSRGAWIAAIVGLLYLAKAYGKFKWRWVLPPILVVAAVTWFFWNTPRTAPWYFQRLDLSRGSVQHRVAAWKVGLEMMRDHPFGVGWNRVVATYAMNYSPPENGVAAITTNDYLMLGTQLGIPGLACFIAYAALCFTNRRLQISKHRPYLTLALSPPAGSGEGIVLPPVTRHLLPEASLRVACRAGALVFLVAFWFDGGLFKLATASVFWILLELGSSERGERIGKNGEGKQRGHLTPALSPFDSQQSAFPRQPSSGLRPPSPAPVSEGNAPVKRGEGEP
jgi:hypothetical protein